MKYFAMTGVAGYIAPRHLQAIHDTGNTLKAALDPNDSVGILDRYFPDASFFTEYERFDRHLDRLRRDTTRRPIDYLSVCTPNYLHDAHIRLALRLGANAICEKPLVANPWQLDALQEMEAESPGKVYSVLQLRVHPALIALRKKIQEAPSDTKYEVNLTYMTSRGPWYLYSWKGNEDKSGGISTNIGVHFYDLLIWLFGPAQSTETHLYERTKASGYIELQNARVSWFLSIDRNDLPPAAKAAGKTTYRSITVNGEEIEFSEGFTDLHTRVYEDILAGNGFGMEDARPAIELVYAIRTSPIKKDLEKAHPILRGEAALSHM
ncbi:MAG: gfo/Idh/MocA family oxidoreductase [Bacteroidetes bacterium]|nr:MAG: gfo/Idh/MocA family oxidoreductase [Bacteroidota bacterium]